MNTKSKEKNSFGKRKEGKERNEQKYKEKISTDLKRGECEKD